VAKSVNVELGSEVRSGEVRSKKARSRLARLVPLLLVAVVFFALGNASRGLDLPKFLGGGNSKVEVSRELNVNVEEIYAKLKDKFDGELTDAKVSEGVKRGLISATNDPYTTYFTKAQYEDFEKGLNGSFSGIGAEIGKNGDQIVIIAPIDGSPAVKSGLKASDAILQIDGVSTEGMSVEEDDLICGAGE
jgi:C-terminal processing protease CtpA/Prc